jgi:hypothetical protein
VEDSYYADGLVCPAIIAVILGKICRRKTVKASGLIWYVSNRAEMPGRLSFVNDETPVFGKDR